MKKYKVETLLTPRLVKEFEDFYESADKEMERRLRDMLLEYCKAEGTTEDNYFPQLMTDMYFLFRLIDECQDHKDSVQKNLPGSTLK